jgi:hypothetical protein
MSEIKYFTPDSDGTYREATSEEIVQIESLYSEDFGTLDVTDHISRLKELQEDAGDIEANHGEADGILTAILTKLGYTEVVEEYNKVDKWYA